MKKLICFDLDGTLTQHRSKLESENCAVLDRLKEKYNIVIVGAGNAPRIYAQTCEYPIDVIGNYGMQEGKIVDGEFKIVREDTVVPDKKFFIENVEYLRNKYGYTQYKGESVEFHPSGMVTFPLLGTNADLADKLAFDPSRQKRKVLYPEVCEIFKDYAVYIGGVRPRSIFRGKTTTSTTLSCVTPPKTVIPRTKFYTSATILRTAAETAISGSGIWTISKSTTTAT